MLSPVANTRHCALDTAEFRVQILVSSTNTAYCLHLDETIVYGIAMETTRLLLGVVNDDSVCVL